MTNLTYEKTTCGRCGGSGRYSWNQINGDRCFGCSGSGQKLSKRGDAARAYANSILDVTIDQFAEMEGRRAVYVDLMTGRKTTFSGVRITGYSKIKSMHDTNWREVPNFALLMRQKDGLMVEASIGLGAGIGVRLVPTEEEIERIARYQENLTKAGKLRANAPADLIESEGAK